MDTSCKKSYISLLDFLKWANSLLTLRRPLTQVQELRGCEHLLTICKMAWKDVPLHKAEFNAVFDDARNRNFRLLTSVLRRQGFETIQRGIDMDKVAKGDFITLLSLCQLIYDACSPFITESHPSAAELVATAKIEHARREKIRKSDPAVCLSASRATLYAALTPAPIITGSVSKARSDTLPPNLGQTMNLDDISAELEVIERERDEYYAILRKIESFCLSNSENAFSDKILSIINGDDVFDQLE